MEYKRKILAFGLISTLIIIGSLVANVYSIKEKSNISKTNVQAENHYKENTRYNNEEYDNYGAESQSVQEENSAVSISRASTQSNWFEEYKESTQDMLDKYSRGNDYLTNAMNTKGQIVKWNRRNLKVFVQEGEYKDTILDGLNVFKSTFGDIFTINTVNDKNFSDIEVVFESRPIANPNSLELGKTMPQYDNDGIIQKSYMQLYTIHPATRQEISKSEIQATFLHEMGHAIGIVGHSQDKDDLMYASSTRKTYSDRDIATIRAMYSGSAPSEEIKAQAAQNKLSEAENYAQKYSKEAIAWINLAQTYYAQNDFAKAANAYKEAIKLSPNDANVYIGLASCYYASKKYDEAIECLKYAQSLNLDSYQKNRIIELLSYNYNEKGDLDNGYFYTREALDANPYNKNNLGNFLIICARTNRKFEAKTSLENYLRAKPEDRNDPALKDFADAFGL